MGNKLYGKIAVITVFFFFFFFLTIWLPTNLYNYLIISNNYK